MNQNLYKRPFCGSGSAEVGIAAVMAAAQAFVAALGQENRKFLTENLRNVETNSDGMAAIKQALYRHPDPDYPHRTS